MKGLLLHAACCAALTLFCGCYTTKAFDPVSGMPIDTPSMKPSATAEDVMILDAVPKNGRVVGYVHSHCVYAPWLVGFLFGWKAQMMPGLQEEAARIGANAIAEVHEDWINPWWRNVLFPSTLWTVGLGPDLARLGLMEPNDGGEVNYHATAIVVPKPRGPKATARRPGSRRTSPIREAYESEAGS